MKNKRNTWLKRAAAFVLCAALVLVTGVFPTRVQAKSLDDLKKDYNELEKEIEANQKKLENIQNQQASNAEKMKLLSSQAEAISSQLDVLNSQLSVLNADIADYDREISALDKKIADAQSKIDKIDADISATQEKISERLRATYMAGSSSWIEILLESDSISSLLLRIQHLASVTENDNKLISKLEKQIEELNAAKAELDKDKKALEEKRSLLVEKKSELDSKNNTLSSKQSAYNANYRQISALMTSLDRSSAEYQQELQRQYRKRAAFERQIDQLVSGGSQGGVNVSYGKIIIAAQSGKVLVRGYSDVGGNYITIDHGDGYRTYYGHCSKIIASAGQYVEKGEVIAYIGNTGYVTGPHVHFQVMQGKNGVVNRLNPLNFVTPPN